MNITLQFISKYVDKPVNLPYTAIHQTTGVHAITKSVLKRSLLKAFLVGAFLFAQLPSHAGIWQVYQFWHETWVMQSGLGPAVDGTFTLDQEFSPVSHDVYYPIWTFGQRDQSTGLSTQVEIKSELRWSPNVDAAGHPDLFDAPPARVYVLVTAEAAAHISYPDSSRATMGAADGLGDTPVLTENIGDELSSAHSFSSGAKLLAIDTNGQSIVKLPTLNTGASVAHPPTTNPHPSHPVYMIVGVKCQDQIVASQISSDIEPSLKKGTIPDQTGSLREPNVRNDDSSITVDTAVVWLPGLLKYADGHWNGGFHISASQNAFQNAYYDWTSSWNNVTALPDPGTPGVILWEDLSAEKGAAFGVGLEFHKPYDANALNQPVTFTVTAKDEDGKISGSLANTYTVNFHLPYENWDKYKADSQPSWQDVTMTVADPGFATCNGGIGLTYQFNPAYLGEAGSVFGADVFGVIGAFTPPPYSGLFAALALGATTLAPVKSNGIANFNDCWNDPDSKFDPPKNNALKSHYRMTPKMQVGYISHYMQADNYASHGYVGPVRKVVAQWDGTQKFTGDFEIPGKGVVDDVPGNIETSPAAFRHAVQGTFQLVPQWLLQSFEIGGFILENNF